MVTDDGPESETEKGSEADLSREASDAALGELEARFAAFEGGEDGTDVAERLRQEAESLLEWAVESGREIDKGSFGAYVEDWKAIGGQSEHHVLLAPDESRVLKTTIPPHFGARGNVAAYVRNLQWSNQLFGDDIRLVGVLEAEAGPMIVTTQPYTEGTEPEIEEIQAWFLDQGYESCGYNQWRHPETGAVIADAHQGNLIKTEAGDLIPIDLQVIQPGISE
ncbi:MAG: hypothetical protein KDN20_06120 [Verrucomicrobiae bacterium]|nr:hypothetical protein [Verrucomicrobiae bacterium]